MGVKILALGLVMLVAGCSLPPIEPVAPKAGAGPVQSVGNSTLAARDARVIARDFITVVRDVEPVAERSCRQRAPRVNCDFAIVIDDRPNMPPNAFQTVDEAGRPIIAFTLALLVETRNRDEIAFVMAHEAAHHIEGHLIQQQRNATVGAAVFGQLAGALGASTAEAVQAAQQIGAEVGARTYSQDFELEADALGTRITHAAGYDPVLGAVFFGRIPDPGDTFLGTHPPNAERIAIVNRVAAGL